MFNMQTMIDENTPCLRLRNQTTRAEETYCKCYLKKFRGYVKHVFINVQTIGLFIMMLFAVGWVAIVTQVWKDDDSKLAFVVGCVFFGIALFSYVYIIARNLWFWQYAKYVVITNEGIWIMHCSAFWWSRNFYGKKSFFGAHWAVYGWNEIKITSDDKARPQTPVKLARMEDNFDYAVIKSSQLTSLFVTRFDGVQQIDFLEESDAQEILDYAKEQQKRKKRKKKDMEIIVEEYDKIPDEYIEDDVE